MFLHWKDGLYQLLCPRCDAENVQKRKDLYGPTRFGWERKLCLSREPKRLIKLDISCSNRQADNFRLRNYAQGQLVGCRGAIKWPYFAMKHVGCRYGNHVLILNAQDYLIEARDVPGGLSKMADQ